MAGQAAMSVPSSSSSSQEDFVPFFEEDVELQPIKLEPRSEFLTPPSSPVSACKVTPIPKARLASLCAVRLVDPIVFTQLFPYVNEMMEWLHVTEDHSKIGFYSGLVVSAHSLSALERLGLKIN